MTGLKDLFGLAAGLMEAAGVAIIFIGCAVMTLRFVPRLRAPGTLYDDYRRAIGKTILLGLEFLIAGDIIRTVAVSHTLESVAVLAVIVLIRALLSVTLGFDVEGRWPWRRPARRADGA
jgi:uncharacterized membrane protein